MPTHTHIVPCASFVGSVTTNVCGRCGAHLEWHKEIPTWNVIGDAIVPANEAALRIQRVLRQAEEA